MKNAQKHQTKTYLHFPHEQDCVKILDILSGYTPEARELVLAVVKANLAGYPNTRVRGNERTGKLRIIERVTTMEARVADVIGSHDSGQAAILWREIEGMEIGAAERSILRLKLAYAFTQAELSGGVEC